MTADENSTARSTTRSPRRAWSLLALLLGVLVAGLATSLLIVVGNGAGSGIGERVSSIVDPPSDATLDREKALAASRTFVQRFNTYGPEMLDDSGAMPEYADVADLMTAKFATVFEDNVGYAEDAVAETGIDRRAQVYAVGISAIDDDSAELLVGGIVEFSYPSPDDSGERIPFDPLRFRYQVSLVKLDGEWLVDDLDDVDDGLPSFGEASEAGTGTTPPAPSRDADPSGAATPSPSPSATTSTGGEQ